MLWHHIRMFKYNNYDSYDRAVNRGATSKAAPRATQHNVTSLRHPRKSNYDTWSSAAAAAAGAVPAATAGPVPARSNVSCSTSRATYCPHPTGKASRAALCPNHSSTASRAAGNPYPAEDKYLCNTIPAAHTRHPGAAGNPHTADTAAARGAATAAV